MFPTIQTICLPLPFRLGTVNCYLVTTDDGHILVDTGPPHRCAALEAELTAAGCERGRLALIALTHGDFDHIGNAAYLGQRFGTPIAMHPDDWGMAEAGDMFWNRKQTNFVAKLLAPLMFGFGKRERFKPDVKLEEDTYLASFGFDARVVQLPGHSRGSVGILTADRDLFCGDLLENLGSPALNSIMDDPATAQASVDKLQQLAVQTVYPGHGQPFQLSDYLATHQEHG